MSEKTAANATHELACSHCCRWEKFYMMPCHVLKEMPDEAKAKWFGLHAEQDGERLRLRAEVETLREIREIASQCAANGGYLCSRDLIELRALLRGGEA